MRLNVGADSSKVNLYPTVNKELTSEVDDTVNEGLAKLKNLVDGYVSISSCYGGMSEGTFDLTSGNNYLFFNEYMTLLAIKLGIENQPMVKVSDVGVKSNATITAGLKLETFIDGLWSSVRSLFKTIQTNVNTFFTKHNSRISTIRTTLTGIQSGLNSDLRKLKVTKLTEVPVTLGFSYPYNANITYTTVSNGLTDVATILGILTRTNTIATSIINRNLLDPDFVNRIKTLNAEIVANEKALADANKGKKVSDLYAPKHDPTPLTLLLNLLTGNVIKTQKEEQDLSVFLSVPSNLEDIFDDDDFNAALADMKQYAKDIVKEVNKVLNDKIVGGKMITEVDITKENGVVLAYTYSKEVPKDVTLSEKSKLLTLVASGISTSNSITNIGNTHTNINASILSTIDTINKIMVEVEKMTDSPSYAICKRLLQNKVKDRLKFMQTFFTTYNTLNKGLLEIAGDGCDGVVAYSLTSIKNFG